MTDKITLTNLVNLQNQTTAVNAINSNNATLVAAIDNTLSRDGTQPNTMGSNLDMNSNQIFNLPSPATANSPARLVDVVSNPNLVLTIPPVGTSGATVPLLNTNNTWSGTNIHNSTETFNGNITLNGGTNNLNGVCTFSAPIIIPPNSISNSSLSTMAANTVKGSIAGGTPSDLNATQVTTLVNPFTSSLPGATPASGGGTTNFLRADASWAPIPSGTLVLLNTLTASNSATLSDLTSLTSTYSWYEIVFQNILPATASTTAELQVHSGGAFQNTSYLTTAAYNSGTGPGQTNPTTFIPLNPGTTGSTTNGMNGFIRVARPDSTTAVKMWYGQMTQPNTGLTNLYVINFTGYWNSNAAIDGFQFFFNSGNITSGVIKIYGIL